MKSKRIDAKQICLGDSIVNTLSNRKPDAPIFFDVGYQEACESLMHEFDALFAQKVELKQRLAHHLAEPSDVVPWHEVKAAALAKLGPRHD
jgi:hypothetical protein